MSKFHEVIEKIRKREHLYCLIIGTQSNYKKDLGELEMLEWSLRQ